MVLPMGQPINRIAELRESRGESRVHLALLCGVGEATIRRWELGESSVPDEQKRRLCSHFGGISVERLMGWDRTEAAA